MTAVYYLILLLVTVFIAFFNIIATVRYDSPGPFVHTLTSCILGVLIVLIFITGDRVSKEENNVMDGLGQYVLEGKRIVYKPFEPDFKAEAATLTSENEKLKNHMSLMVELLKKAKDNYLISTEEYNLVPTEVVDEYRRTH